MAGEMKRKIVLENGTEYYGIGFGADCERVCELVFNTSVVGYQEIVTDPTYWGMMVVMTYPVIGNYGIADDDYESKLLSVGALVTREYNDFPSNFRYTKTLAEILEENRIPAICGVDTRKLTAEIRDNGRMRAIITYAETSKEAALEKIAQTPVEHNAVSLASCKKRWYSRTSNHVLNVVAIDCGIKLSLIKALNSRGCNVVVMPWNTTAEQVLSTRPDGVIISNGPGAPEDIDEVVELVKALRGKVPVMGIGLGQTVIARAFGADTYKLRCHRAGSHPVRSTETGRIDTVCANYGYAVDAESAQKAGLTVTYTNMYDNTVEGIECAEDAVFAVQFNPESAPGPQDSVYIMDRFVQQMKKSR